MLIGKCVLTVALLHSLDARLAYWSTIDLQDH
jgi:hypothetical protein